MEVWHGLGGKRKKAEGRVKDGQWGGPANFDVTVNYTAGPAATLKYTNANPGIGAVYVPKGVPFTIQ